MASTSLRRGFAWTLTSTLAVNGARWVMFVALTKLVAPTEVGRFAYALALATPITMFAQLNLRTVLITDVRGEHAFGDLLALRLVTSAAAVAAAAGVAVTRGDPSLVALVAVVALGQALDSQRDLWNGVCHKHERFDLASIGSFAESVASVALFVGALAVRDDVTVAAATLIAARLAVLWAYDVPRARSLTDEPLRPRWDPRALRALAWTALPLGVTTALTSLTTNIPRYFLEASAGPDALAHFAALAYLTLIANMVIAALSRVASPRLARHYRHARRDYVRLLGKLLALGAALGVAAIAVAAAIGEPFLELVYDARYAAHADALVILTAAVAVLFPTTFLGVAVSSAREFRAQLVTYPVVVLATLAACAALVPEGGVEGAAWAMLAGAVVNLAVNAALVVIVTRRPA